METTHWRKQAWLLLPAAILTGAFFLLPLTYLLVYSFYQYSPTTLIIHTFTPENYTRFFRDQIFWGVLVRSLRVAFWVTVVCAVFGYPVAYQFARSKSRWRAMIMMVIVSPLFITPVIRTFGLQLILADGGLINELLIWSGLRQEAVRMLFTEGAVVFSLAIVCLSFMILSLSAVIRGIDPALEEAAQNLGANWFRTFLQVTLPLSLPGVMAGSILVFISALGAYATPIMIGGTRVRMMVVEIYEQFSSVGNWPFGSAVSFILLGTALVLLILYTMLLSRTAGSGPGRDRG